MKLIVLSGAPDCSDGYDEDARLCTAGKKPYKYILRYTLEYIFKNMAFIKAANTRI